MRLLLPLLLLVLSPLLTASAVRQAPAAEPPALAAADRKFVAVLGGQKAIPPNESAASARATFLLSADGASLRYRVTVARLNNLTLVALRQGGSAAEGPPVALLFGPRVVRGQANGLLVEGTLTAADLSGPLVGAPSLAALAAAMRAQTVYVEIDTVAFPRGELRGQVHPDRRRRADL
jgi:hypothetical protein